MSRWLLVCSTLLLTLGSMSRARIILGSNSNLSGGVNGGVQPLPKEELELESLKEKNHKVQSSEGKPGTSSTSSPPTLPKAALNMEHPTQSDNDNENSGKSPPKSEMAGEEKRKEFGGFGNAPETNYSPRDIAEYVFFTNDKEGVALAINDFLQEKLVTKEDVIRFLEEVKLELDQLKNRYSALTQLQVAPIQQNLPSFPLSAKNRLYFPKRKDLPGDWSLFDFDNYNGLNLGGRNSVPASFSQFVPLSSKPEKIQSSASTEEDDYEELKNGLNMLRQADSKYREYSLEEIIYQLAKELFSQELQEQPQHSVQRFAHFLENEAALGNIPKDLGKAVLDTLVGALIDTVNEQGNLKLDSPPQQQQQQQQQQQLSIPSKPKPTAQPQKQHPLFQSAANLKAGK